MTNYATHLRGQAAHRERFQRDIAEAVARGGTANPSPNPSPNPNPDPDPNPDPTLTLPNPNQARGGTAMPDPPELQRWYEAELLWDEYVAESIANYMQGMQKAGNGDEARLVVLAAASRVQARA